MINKKLSETVFVANCVAGKKESRGRPLLLLMIAGFMLLISVSPLYALTITGNTPAADASDVAADTDITVTFSENIASETVLDSMFEVKGASSGLHGFDFSTSGSTVTINPDAYFTRGENITVKVTPEGITNTGGDPMTETGARSWDFSVMHGIKSTSPSANSVKVPADTKITLTFSRDIQPESVSAASVSVSITGSVSGAVGSELEASGKSDVSVTPAKVFVLGEDVTVEVKTNGIKDVDGTSFQPQTLEWQFFVIAFGNIRFFDSGRDLESSSSRGVALMDIDKDGDIDAFVANGGGSGSDVSKRINKVWKNNGNGIFTDSGQTLGDSCSYGVALDDLNGDGYFDAFVVNGSGDSGSGIWGSPNQVWINDGDGKGTFSNSNQSLGEADSRGVALGDFDKDGNLDAFVVNFPHSQQSLDGANKIWLGDGEGNFTDSGQSLGSSSSNGVALGHLNKDNQIDAFVANFGANTVWINNGGTFSSESEHSLGSLNSNAVALGDVDRDGNIDAFVANFAQPNKVWLNSGTGNFSDSGQNIGTAASFGVVLKDIDGDGALDAFVTNGQKKTNKVWVNDGQGAFADSGQILGSSTSAAGAVGDVDGDDDLDIVVANFGSPSKIWLNNSPPESDKTSASVTMDENETPNPFSLTLTATDYEGQTLKWDISTKPAHGGAYVENVRQESGVLVSEADIVYDSEPNYSGTDSFEVQVSDGIDTAMISVTVSIIPNIPEITGENPTVDMGEDASPDPSNPDGVSDFSLTLNASDISDPQGEHLTWSISGSASKGTAGIEGKGNSADISYTPNPDYNGTDSFSVRVSDDQGGKDTITVFVNIAPRPDPPQIVAQKTILSATENISVTITLNDLAVTDPDTKNISPNDFSVRILEGANYALSADNIIAPYAGFVGTLTVPVVVNDGTSDSDSFDVSIKVYPLGDIDGDNVTDIRDVIIMLRILSDIRDAGISITLNAADVNRDGRIGTEDAVFILREISK